MTYLAIDALEDDREFVIVTLPNGREVHAWTARSEMERIQGLSGVDDMPFDYGMLFFFDEQDYRGFWMKDMFLALDLIWIQENTIVGIEEGMQPEFPVETIYKSPVPVDKVLEVNAGFIEVHALEIGDILDIQAVEEYSSVE
jgi:uncharacterized membrane protein (UPF0127 family)